MNVKENKMLINLNKFNNQAEELQFKNKALYEMLVEDYSFTDTEINELDSIDFDAESPCEYCLENAKVVEADSDDEPEYCYDCQQERYINRADFIYESWKDSGL